MTNPTTVQMLNEFDDLADHLGSLDAALAQCSPAVRRNLERRFRIEDLEFAVRRRMPWFGWPVIEPAWVFWTSLASGGARNAIDAMCFSFLDDRNPAWRWCYRQEEH